MKIKPVEINYEDTELYGYPMKEMDDHEVIHNLVRAVNKLIEEVEVKGLIIEEMTKNMDKLVNIVETQKASINVLLNNK